MSSLVGLFQDVVAKRLSLELSAGILIAAFVTTSVIHNTTKSFIGSLSPKQHKHGFWAASALSAVVLIGMGAIEERVRNSTSPHGQVSFQVAFTPEGSRAVMNTWNEAQRIWMGVSLGADNLFIAAYTTMLALGAINVGKGDRWAMRVATMSYLSGMADFIEGVFLTLILVNPNDFDERFPLGAGLCALIKFALLGVVIAYVLSGFAIHRLDPATGE